MFITRYNLSGAAKSSVDVNYMIYTVSNKNLFLLEENAALLPTLNMYPEMPAEAVRRGIELKRERFDKAMERFSWKSWNGADEKNKRQ